MNGWRKLSFAVVLALMAFPALADVFPRPPQIEPAVGFWTKVYSQVGTDGGLLHDRENLDVVYDTLGFTENLWHPARERKIRQRRSHYEQILGTLASGKRDNLSPDEARVLALWPDDVSNERLRRAAGDIRFQLGQADRFREGLKRAGAWRPYIYQTLDDLGLPRELLALAHVESSFNPDAWSRIGAAGIWQFTRPTGRQYMQVDHILDQRMDPFTATRAAGLLLRHNYSVTEDWGQAVTAYNHGLAGIRRAVRDTGSEDIGEIISTYSGRNWGFASRNFYPAFLAAVYVDANAETYFGELETHPPLRTTTIELPFYTSLDQVLSAFDVERDTLRELNRGLRDPIWSGQKYLPRGYPLRLPAAERDELMARLKRIDEDRRFFAQIPDREHVVRSGEALSTIASRYNTSVRELMAMNNIRNANLVRAGQTLRLPVDGEAEPIASERYQVRRGDNLSLIAYRAGMSLEALAAANGIDPEQPIQPGMELRVDGRPADGVNTIVTAQVADTESPPAADEPRVTAFSPGDSGGELVSRLLTTVNNLMRADGPRPPLISAAASRPETDTTGANTYADSADAEFMEADAMDADYAATSISEADDELLTDPADYSVADNSSIEIQAAETLGHYAEWLELRAADLRRVNNMSFNTPLVIGRRLTLSFDQVTPEQFEQRRRRYHRDVQASFFARHRIDDTRTHRVESGDSLWSLTRPNTDIPVWLLRQHNPDMDFAALRPGTEIQLPVVNRKE